MRMGSKDAASAAKRRIRVAICHPDLGIGGAERLVVDAALELKDHGYEIHVFTAHHDPRRCFEETANGSFPVMVYGNFLPRHVFYRLHAVCAYLRCLWVALMMVLFWPPFDLIFADQVSAVIPVLRLHRRTKVLFYCHFPDMLLAQRASILKRIYRTPIDWVEQITTGMAHRVLVNSEYTAETFATAFGRLHRRGIKPSVLYPAVDIRQFDAVPAAPPLEDVPCVRGESGGTGVAGISGLHASAHIFVSINRFERKKNIKLAIEALANVKQKRLQLHKPQDVRLVIAGGYDPRLAENREHLEELRQLAEAEDLEYEVEFLPSFSNAQKLALLSASLCVIYTPENEHFGIVPLEAMAARRPVIACNSGGPKESVIHTSTGFLCEPNPKSFAAAMEALLASPENAIAMGSKAREHVERNFSRQVFGDRLDAIIKEMLAGSSRS